MSLSVHQATSGHAIPGGLILLVLVTIAIIVYVGMTRRRS
jgi:hypothetical protein